VQDKFTTGKLYVARKSMLQQSSANVLFYFCFSSFSSLLTLGTLLKFFLGICFRTLTNSHLPGGKAL